MPNANNNEKTTEAVSYIWKLIANLSAGSVITLLLSFVIGYKYEKSYLSGIGARWAFELLSFNEIILGSFSVLTPLLIGFIISLNYLYNFENGVRIVGKAEKWASGIGLFLYLLTVIQSYFIPDEYQKLASALRHFSIYSFSFSVGFLIAEILVRFRDLELKINHPTFNTLVYLSITVFFIIPNLFYITAHDDIKLYDEKLVKTCILSEGCAEYWYIVRPINVNFLVFNVGKNGQKAFRLVSVSDVVVKP